MPTDTTQGHSPRQALNFALRALAWGISLFGLVRLSWVEAHVVLPGTRLQAWLAASLLGSPGLPIEVSLACSGADALALCMGAILAYPAIWRRRLGGVLGGLGLIFALNVLRIGTLALAVNSPAWFEALHTFVWPALLTLGIAGYVFAWMGFAEKGRAVGPAGPAGALPADQPTRQTPSLPGRFALWTFISLLLFTAASPLYLESAAVLAVAAFIARTAALGLRLMGMQANATANVLVTARGAFEVTQECISTPLIPVYLAAVLAYTNKWRRRAVGLLAAVPLFVGLGVARLLVVALPAGLVGSPIFLIHAFYQLLLAGVAVLFTAFWRHGTATAWRRALLGAAMGSLFLYLFGSSYGHALEMAVAPGAALEDPQGAITLLPGFQVGLYIALYVAAFVVMRWRRFAFGLALLALSQVALRAGLVFLMRHGGLAPRVLDVRALALGVPIALVVAMVRYHLPWWLPSRRASSGSALAPSAPGGRTPCSPWQPSDVTTTRSP